MSASCTASPSPPSGFDGTARWYVYLLRCADGSLYAGCTKDLSARERKHNEGRGARYTAGRRPVQMVYAEACPSRGAAQSREAEIKRWPRARKQALINRAATGSG